MLKSLMFAGGLCLLAGGAPAEAAGALQAAITPGGNRYYFQADPDGSKSAIALVWKRGYGTYEPGKEAVPGIGAQALLAGSKRMPEGEFIETAIDLQLNGAVFANPTRTIALVEAPSRYFADAVGLFAPLLTEPSLAERSIARQRRNAADAIRQTLLKPEPLAIAIAARALTGPHAIFRARSGDAMEKVTAADIELWRQRTFSRDEVIIVAIGNLPEAVYAQAIDQLISPLPQLGPGPVMEPLPARTRPMTILMEADVPQTGLAMVGRTGLRGDADLVADDMANQILGGGAESRLFRAVRQDLGATYGISSQLDTGLGDPVTLIAHSALDNAKAGAGIALAGQVYAKWRSEGVRAEEAEAARGILIQSQQQGTREAGRRAVTFASALANGRAPAKVAESEQQLRAATLADVNDVIATYFPAAPLLTVIVTPKAEGFVADCVIHTLEEAFGCGAK